MKTTKIYIFNQRDPVVKQVHVDGLCSISLSSLVGETLATMLCNSSFPDGLQLVRLKLGNSKIIAYNRISDIKVVVENYEN